MELNLSEIVNTLLGVSAGGIISIVTSNLVNKKNLKNQFMFDLLSETKLLLSEWTNDLLNNGVEFCECEYVKQYKGYKLSNSARILIQKIETNKYILSNFNDEFIEIRSRDIRLQMKNDEYKKEILKLSKKYNTENTLELLEYEDVAKIINNYAEDIMALIKKIETLITKIDNYIYKKIL
ncbi:hypothetical protein [Terrisporobacter hibernicus]|uniref:Uncharacterized protein n=1 Tax=Terrisporobacter hibernicus TaxID=2813371 RepID=A0AAX2ZGV0_9FIRM|nr:hypothetical protein [Terrisporobacter hibernicus]UEL48291.1 hypothetical protein JW646_02225 [Terrisporobacter hibernicus]